MRKPIENALACIAMPRSYNMANVSRALWPSASTTWLAAIAYKRPDAVSQTCSASKLCMPALLPGARCNCTSTTCCPKRTSPPSTSMRARRFSTTLTNLKVPICGCASYKISGGAPACTNSFITLRPRWRGSRIWLHNLPSENVPAPPSPNCTLLCTCKVFLRHKSQVSLVR